MHPEAWLLCPSEAGRCSDVLCEEMHDHDQMAGGDYCSEAEDQCGYYDDAGVSVGYDLSYPPMHGKCMAS